MDFIDDESFYTKMAVLDKQQLELHLFDEYVIITLGNMELNIKKDKARILYNLLGESLYRQKPEEVDGFFDYWEAI